jgi:hypothetical protein
MDHPEGMSSQRADRVDFDRRVRVEFRGAQISSDGGRLVMRKLDDALGLSDLPAAALRDIRPGKNTIHRLDGLFRQSVFGRLAGYEDGWNWQDRSVHRAEERYRRARKLRLRGPIQPVPAVCATDAAARGEKRLSSGQTQAILTSDGRPLGECRLPVLRKDHTIKPWDQTLEPAEHDLDPIACIDACHTEWLCRETSGRGCRGKTTGHLGNVGLVMRITSFPGHNLAIRSHRR